MTVNKPRRPKPNKKNLAALKVAIDFFGGERKDLAKAIGISRAVVGDWYLGNCAVSLRCALLIEKKTKGLVSALRLIPEIKTGR